MKKQTKQIAVALLVLASLLVTGCTEQQISADKIAANMAASTERIEDFSATLVRISPDDGENITVRAKVLFKPPDNIEPAELVGTVIVKNGRVVWWYGPVKNQVTKMTRPDGESSEVDYTGIAMDLLEKNDISYNGLIISAGGARM
jgi:outer membrane lipoprotein-sorting protein